MTTDQLRSKFLSFFASKGHPVIPSDSLVPKDDPSLLFTGAGMNQLKDYFLGKRKDMKRAASCQKCMRTGDLDNVGKTPSHHSFFEMLGNFSFGDYFKEEAIAWAWEFLTKELGMKEKDLWVSVYKDDDEAYKIWSERIKVPKEKITRFGAHDNFWPANAPEDGPNGPCGPCSEIYVDRGEKYGCGDPKCGPGCGKCKRYVEVWNLVFTQFNRVGVNKLEPLPSKNIDTGMGLERLASVIQGVETNFETDIFMPIIKAILELIEDDDRKLYALDEDGKKHINAIADHIRATVFCIADGVLPSNTGRGYVVKHLIRRSLVHGKFFDINKPFLYKLVDPVVRVMKGGYSEIESRRENISLIIKSEEEKFYVISNDLWEHLEIQATILKKNCKDTIPGDMIFYFHDTKGLSIELMKEYAADWQLKLDLEGYEKLMEEQRKKSRGATKLSGDIFAETLTAAVLGSGVRSEFIGYDKLESSAAIKAIIIDNKPANEVTGPSEFAVILDVTPFYGETGGQVGDTGVLENNDFKADVLDTKLIEKIPVHICRLEKGRVKTGDKVNAKVDIHRRMAIARHHTATHLLQAALRKVLGAHVNQSGSLVAPERLRFDFTHFKGLTGEELEAAESLVNDYIRRNAPLKVKEMDLEEAKKSGATALFGEKYDRNVRVVSVEDISRELCGGTHLNATGEIGLFKITGESSVAAGIRRIEAIAGEAAYNKIKESESDLKAVAEMLKVKPENLPAQIEKLADRVKDLEKKLKNYEAANISEKAKDLVSKKELLDNSITLIARRMDGCAPDTLVSLTDAIKTVLKEKAVSILLGAYDEKAFIVVGMSRDLAKSGLDSRAVIKYISKIILGGGGGRPDLAQAGGKDISKLDEALKAGIAAVKELKI
ncbi:MAG: alanine--tRNA ligase [Candidatus Omnitrophica bacterium]|nr:alanine--tRNA ligase [Candidatus Omnitrophota bacterium]